MSTDLTDAREDRPDRSGVANSLRLTQIYPGSSSFIIPRPLLDRTIAPRTLMVGVNAPCSNVGVLVGVLS